MSSREEKLSAARKKLREFQGKARDVETKELSRKNSAASSPSPGLFLPEGNNPSRPETPVDSARLAWERRQTIAVDDSQQNLPNSGRNSEVIIPFDDGKSEKISVLEMQCNAMREQLQRQGQVINVLVSERNEAQTALSRVQSELQQKSDSLEDLKNKYFEASRRVHDLENSPSRLLGVTSPLKDEEKKRAEEAVEQRISLLQEQLSEVSSRLGSKNLECDALTKKVLQLENSLSVAQVKIQQLTIDDGSVTNDREKKLEESFEAIRKENDLLKRRLQAAAMEGEQASHRFQVYADQCNAQQTTLRSQLREIMEESKRFRDENEALKAQVSSLELQINDKNQQEHPLVTRIDELCKETARLAHSLQDKEATISNLDQQLKASIEQLTSMNEELEAARSYAKRIEAKADSGRPDPALLAAMESDKVAASRAVAQNQKLKDQLNELQDALLRVNEEKLSLSERLSQTEHENYELRKQVQSHGHHESDSCDHDHNHEHDHEEEDQDVETLRNMIAALQRDKTELIDRLAQSQNLNGRHHNHDDHNHDEHCHDSKNEAIALKDVNEEVVQLRRAVKQLQEDKAELLHRLGAPCEDPEVQSLLETKLTRTMNEIAKLDEEKERLEHLVLQLQSETETIGEYITLYHKQRILLKQRSVEKDEQLHQLSKDREELKEKLESLNGLVAKLVEEREKGSEILNVPERIEEVTAKKIKALITEIGNNNVVNSHTVAFDQCSCCSGRLITV